MDTQTEREIQKLRDEIAQLRQRVDGQISTLGGSIDRQLSLLGWLSFDERASPGTPAANKIRVYHKTGGGLVFLDEDGSEIELDGGKIFLDATKDVCPDGDLHGLWERLINQRTMATYTSHFRDGTLPAGHTWQGAPFSATWAGIVLGYNDSFMQATPAAGPLRHFLADAVSTVANKSLYCRMSGSNSPEFGVRMDDGTDDNYTELICEPSGNPGTYQLNYRYRTGGGGITEVTALEVPYSQMVTVQLYNYTTGGNHIGYLATEAGVGISVAGMSRAVAWTVSRVGIVVDGVSAWQSYMDWYHSDFS